MAEAQVRSYTNLILDASVQYEVPASLIAGTMLVESGGDPNATSSAWAIGLMQVMPFHFGRDENPYDPYTNVMKGASILRSGYDRCGSWDVAIAAYFGAVSGCTITGASDGSGVTGYSYVELVKQAQQQFLDMDSSAGTDGAGTDGAGADWPIPGLPVELDANSLALGALIIAGVLLVVAR